MVEIIAGDRGSGKTKRLIEFVNSRGEESIGNVVCIEKGKGLSASINNTVRLIDSEEYHIQGPEEYYGFIAGLLAGNYDITDIFTDATFKIICGEDCKDMNVLESFLHRVAELGKLYNCRILFTVSADESELPESIKQFLV